MDREKVINCLTDIENIMIARQDICPREELQYWIELQEGVADALALLNEQEAVPCGEKIKAGDVMLDFYECGHCKNAIRKPWRYCPFCGKAVKLE